jgi:tetratricopeptide (TPR) repeat protein
MAYYYQGLVYEKQGDKAAAVQSYNAALAINPTLKQASDALKRL